MNKTRIEYCNYTINPVKGLCPVACPYCYAKAMYKRFKWNPEIRFEPETMSSGILSHLKPSRIFIGSTIELFGNWIKDEWLKWVFAMCKVFPQHTFIFLTKQPQNLIKWSPFPENCWVGVTATNARDVLRASDYLFGHKIAKIQFISIEPLLSWDTFKFAYSFCDSISKKDFDWLIIGQQTPISVKTQPKIEWIQEIVEAADKAGIPVFLKDNLYSLWNKKPIPLHLQCKYNADLLRQEFPR